MSEKEIAESSGLFPSRAIAIASLLAVAVLAGAIGFAVGNSNSEFELSETDRGFVADMMDHHEQAVLLSRYVTEHGATSTVRGYADDVVTFQRWELGKMDTWLSESGYSRPTGDNRTVMEWMDHPVPLKDMPGLATEEQIEALYAETGDDVDRLFLQLMINHHLGGVEMAKEFMRRGSDDDVIDLAGVIVANQDKEIAEYTRTLEQMGGRPLPAPEEHSAG